jgi:hypothetical protein
MDYRLQLTARVTQLVLTMIPQQGGWALHEDAAECDVDTGDV